ncbi:nephrocystin-4-like, partial [Silurus meridionalis]
AAFPSAAARPSLPAATGSPMALPATFSGEPSECRGFLMQVNLYIEMQPQRFPTERSKVAFFISLKSGKALAWAQSLWEAVGPVVNAYAPFTAHFLELFSAASGVLTTAYQLLSLCQGDDTITDYSLRFRTLAASSGWNESALLGVYRQGLSPEIRQAMAVYDDKVGLEGFIQNSIGLSQRLAACTLTPPQPTPLPLVTPPGAQAAAGSEPMQLGSQRLSRRERNSRLVTGKCLYCGKPGH